MTRKRVAGLASQFADEGGLEDEIGPEHPQVATCRMLVVKRHLGHERVERNHRGVVRHDQRAGVGRHVLQTGHLHPEP